MRPLDPEAGLQHALDLAYRYLGMRDRTVREVRRYLERKRVEPEAIESAVVELGRQGYLDDGRYATRFTEDRRTLDHWGSDRIERRLLAAGVDAEVVRAALQADDPEDELAGARRLLERRFPSGCGGDRDRQRALGQLVRKGYDLELAHEAIRSYARDREAA